MKVFKKVHTEILADRITRWLFEGTEQNEIAYLTAKLGLESILINISKGFIVYMIAILFQTVLPTFITHATYVLLRKFSQGLHAKSSFVCTVVSVTLFVILPAIMQNIILSRPVVFFIGIIVTCLFYLYAPADTEKSPILNAETRNHLKWRSVWSSALITVVALIVPYPMVRTLMVLGLVLQIIMILPITYKLLGRRYRNYEEYETEV